MLCHQSLKFLDSLRFPQIEIDKGEFYTCILRPTKLLLDGSWAAKRLKRRQVSAVRNLPSPYSIPEGKRKGLGSNPQKALISGDPSGVSRDSRTTLRKRKAPRRSGTRTVMRATRWLPVLDETRPKRNGPTRAAAREAIVYSPNEKPEISSG